MNKVFICVVYLMTVSVDRLYIVEDWNETHAHYVEHT
jgi:hypothetical protein